MPHIIRQGDLIITSITEEQPEQEQDYYKENRGPIIQVQGPHTEIKLSFIPNEEEDDENFACENLEPFLATTRGIDKQFITLRNEGTTAIRCQWLRFPPNIEAEFLLANPAGSVLPGGSTFRKTGLRKRLNDEKVCKPSCREFRFRELPSVLLPGQSLEYDIVFRSQTPGYFYENIYLLTHPKLRDAKGRGYSLRLTGICMDPDFAESPEETDSSKSRPENISEIGHQTTLEEEAKDLIDSILDHALFIQTDHPSTLPYLKVTSESIFYTHNRNLKYYHEISQQSLNTVRRLIERLVPQQRIEQNEKVCTLSIESLYQLLWTRNSSQDLYWTYFKTNTTENLLKKLASYNNTLIQPRRYFYTSAPSRKITSSYSTLVTLMDQILKAMDNIDDLYSSYDLQVIFINIAMQKYESGTLYEKDEINNWDFGSFISSMNEENSDSIESIERKTDLASVVENEQKIETKIQEVIEKPSTTESTSHRTKTNMLEAKESKRRRRKSDHIVQNLGKKWKKKSKQPGKDDVDLQGTDDEELIVAQAQPTSTTTEIEESRPGSVIGIANSGESGEGLGTTPVVTEDGKDEAHIITPISQQLSELPLAVQQQFLEEKKRRIYQAKRMVFEDLLAEGIERIICAVDAFNAMEDYRPSELSASHSSASIDYCCSAD